MLYKLENVLRWLSVAHRPTKGGRCSSQRFEELEDPGVIPTGLHSAVFSVPKALCSNTELSKLSPDYIYYRN